MPLSIKGSGKHGGIFLRHAANRGPSDSSEIKILCQDNELSAIAAGTPVIDTRGKGEQLIYRGNLIRILFRSASPGEDAFIS